MAQMGNLVMGISDTIMLGHVSVTSLAAAGLANQVYYLFMVLGMGSLTALASMTANAKAEGKPELCGELLRGGIELSFLLSLLLTSAIIGATELLPFLNPDNAVVAEAKPYMRIIGVSTIPLMLFYSIKFYADGLNLNKPAMYITWLAVVGNLLLNWIFIYGNLGFPALGARGAAIATLICRMGMAMGMMAVLFSHSGFRAYLPPMISRFKTNTLYQKIVRLGFPAGFLLFFEMGVFSVTAVLAGWQGTATLAGHQVLLGVVALIHMVTSGIAAGTGISMASSFTQNDKASMRRTAQKGMMLIIAAFCALSGLLMIFPNTVFGIFINNEAVIEACKDTLWIGIAFLLADSIQGFAQNGLRVMEDIAKPAKIGLWVYWFLALPLSYLLVNAFSEPLSGLWTALLAGQATVAIWLLSRYRKLAFSVEKRYESITLEKDN